MRWTLAFPGITGTCEVDRLDRTHKGCRRRTRRGVFAPICGTIMLCGQHMPEEHRKPARDRRRLAAQLSD